MNFIPFMSGRFFGDFEVQNRRNVIVLGYSPAEAMFLTRGIDPIGKVIRVGRDSYTVVGVMDKRPAALGDANGFAVIPYTTYEKRYPTPRFRGIVFRPLTIVVSSAEGVNVDELRTEIESIMRARHRLKLGEENDFDTVTADFIVGVPAAVHEGRGAGAVRHFLDRPDGGRHRRDGHHDHLGHRADA